MLNSNVLETVKDVRMRFRRGYCTVQTHPWVLAEREHLPDGNTKHPGVGSVAELPGTQRLGSAPRERDLLMLGHDIAVLLLGKRSHQSEIPDLNLVDGG